MNKLLTPLELKVMSVLWTIQKGFIKDILAHWPDAPKPAYNTISTIVRLLEEKKKGNQPFIKHHTRGRAHEYYPAITQEEYQRTFLQSALDNVFSGSVHSLLSTLVDDQKMSAEDIEALRRFIDAS